MNNHRLSPSAAPGAGPAEEIARQLSALYQLTEDSPQIFGSPLGPFTLRGRSFHLARFVYFGPQSADDSVRLAFYAGLDGADTRCVRALADFVAGLAFAPDLGQGLNLSFFPALNPSGLAHATSRNLNATDLVRESWQDSEEPEIALLRQDARVRGYHGFVRIESAAVDKVTGLLRMPGESSGVGGREVVDAQRSSDFAVEWQFPPGPPREGPLTMADDFAVRPFELVLRFPAAWTDDVTREAVAGVLRQFIVQYRATLSFGLNL